MKLDKEEIGDLCDRCGERGQDRRSLWHACMYEMSELNVPFKEIELKSIDPKNIVTETRMSPYKVTTYKEGKEPEVSEGYREVKDYKAAENSQVFSRRFYTLYVCKSCRGDWMKAIEEWFLHKPERD